MTIQGALDGWYLHLRADNVSPGTLERHARVWRRFASWLALNEITEIDQLRADHLRRYVVERITEVKGITAHYEVTPIKSFTPLASSGDVECLDCPG